MFIQPKNLSILAKKIFLSFIVVVLVVFSGCAQNQEDPLADTSLDNANLSEMTTPENSKEVNQESLTIQAILDIREILDIPQLDLKYLGLTTMANSPSGNLPVETYQDSEGRFFYVHRPGNRVVEIDARVILSSESSLPLMPPDEIYTKGVSYANGLIPGFETLQSSLTYRGGAKVDVYFLDWLDETQSGMMMPPRLQIGLDEHGNLFALINTLGLND